MNNRKFGAIAGAVFGTMLALPLMADDMSGKSSADQRFAMEAARGGMAEVQLGQLAKDKGSSDAVKNFGQQMVDDHTKANEQLKAIATQSGITLPTDVSAKDKAGMGRLSKMSGEAFDRAYMQMMLKDHKKDIAEFQKEANGGKDANIKKFASDALPTLQHHLQMAQEASGKTVSHSADRMKQPDMKPESK